MACLLEAPSGGTRTVLVPCHRPYYSTEQKPRQAALCCTLEHPPLRLPRIGLLPLHRPLATFEKMGHVTFPTGPASVLDRILRPSNALSTKKYRGTPLLNMVQIDQGRQTELFNLVVNLVTMLRSVATRVGV